ncbi:Endonuclease/exonuclease/phosphatase [Crucibulum laeve]|uniref:Endonuclease/exonuclease/phosphatase n=1 Tax=Crucibulum laeve TaxID=68775 RepID=A0A5C3M577_9AGAR|nr:Endonuclease/exonuclease/phosphatase [Crucibulum laeve]
MMNKIYSLLFFTSYLAVASSTTIADIQGTAWQSPLVGQTVNNVTGIVTAKGTSGFYISGDKSDDIRASNGLFVFSSSATVLGKVTVGDAISLTGRVTEFRSSTQPTFLFTTELSSPTNIIVLSSNNTITPVVLGKDRSPPTQKFSALDVGPDGFLSVPNNSSSIEAINATLQPDLYGMDFWESLEGQLVTIPKPTSTAFQNSFGEFWVYGDWPVTGKNSRGGLSITFGPDGIPDGNPETVIVGSPLDGTKNPKVAVGMGLTDITGVITYQFGFFYVLPLTAPQIISTPSPDIPATSLTSDIEDTCTITFGDYNVENMAPTSSHLPTVASHIVNLLHLPDIMFIQEIQDNSGPKDDGTVEANVTLSTLVAAIAKLSNVTYAFTQISPIDGQDGGEPGGNIRQVYLYRPEKFSLVAGSPTGGSLDKVEVTGSFLKPKLSFNPGRIDPTNEAFNSSRKPLAAAWQTKSGAQLFTVNVHLSSKGGSSSTQGDPRPPVNSPIEARTDQVKAVSTFVKSLLLKNPLAKIVVAGDFNEYLQTRSVYKSLTTVLSDIDEAAKTPIVERYSYVFDQNSEQLDHAFISLALRLRKVEFEHIHVNNWSPSLAARVSDHDPSVGRIRIC